MRTTDNIPDYYVTLYDRWQGDSGMLRPDVIMPSEEECECALAKTYDITLEQEAAVLEAMMNAGWFVGDEDSEDFFEWLAGVRGF